MSLRYQGKMVGVVLLMFTADKSRVSLLFGRWGLLFSIGIIPGKRKLCDAAQ